MAGISRIIDPTSLSFESIKADITAYIQSRSDYEAWKDFYEGGAGTTQIELISGLASYLAFHSIGARRETFIDQRRLYSSALNIASTLGYPVNRVSAPRFKITVQTDRSFYLDREVPLATFKDFSITPLYSRTVPEGTSDIECVLGTWESFEYLVQSNDLFQILQVVSTDIDNNRLRDTLELFINNQRVELVDYAEEMLDNAVLLRTYLDGVMLIFGDGILGVRLKNNDNIKFNYIHATAPQEFLTLDPSQLSTTYTGVRFTDFVNLDPGSEPDSINKLAALPQGYFASKRRMLTGYDHVNMLMSYSGDLISASYNKLADTCCTIVLAYLFSDEHIASEPEKELILSYLDNFKVVGARLLLTDPVKWGLMGKMAVVTEEGVDTSKLLDQLVSIVEGHTHKLGQTFHAGAITAEFSKVEGVRRVYISYPTSDKELEYDEYLSLVYYDVLFTTNEDYTMEIDPQNIGFYKMIHQGYTTSTSENALVDSTATFTEYVESNDYVMSPVDKLTRARVLSVVSDTELLLDKNIFLSPEMKYEIYKFSEPIPPNDPEDGEGE